MNNNDLALILNSHIPLIVLQTYDEPRALDLLKGFFSIEQMPAWRWSATEGLGTLGLGIELADASNYREPALLLDNIAKQRTPSAYILCDFHPYLDDPKLIRAVKDIAIRRRGCAHKLVLLSHAVTLPPELARYSATLSMALPSNDEILGIVRDEARAWSAQKGNQRVRTDNASLKKLVANLAGLPHQDVRRLAHGAIADDGAITESDLPAVTKAKFALMDMEGVLHFDYSTTQMSDVAGLSRLKQWLEHRRSAFMEEQSQAGLDTPKGVLLFGVQGGGKSLAAKAVAGLWGLPLLRLDMAALFNKYVGETERNLREALALADTMAPCVLWMDELEKGISHQGSDSDTAKRLLGTLLTWMAERTSAVFLTATSNDISCLPPELLRKGRFDEIFFVDLPNADARESIFTIHLAKRGHDVAQFDVKLLADLSEGFTGAEIEQAIVSASYASATKPGGIATGNIIQAVQQTQPLSVVMAEQITALRLWAKDRAVNAGP